MTSYNLLVNKLEVPVASFLRCFALVMLASLWCRAAAADPIADFYRGKVINLVIGYSAGGGFDLYARAVGRHLGRHIPGNPAIVPHNMPGAGSVQAALFMAGAAPQDGTAIATVAQSMALQQAMGDSSIRFHMRRFNWIGNPIQGVSTIATWRASGVHSIADAKRRDVSIGATGINVTMQYPQVLNSLIGTRFKVVIGYPGGNDIALAMERREVDGVGQLNWITLKSGHPSWVRDKKVDLLVQFGLAKLPEISAYMGHDVPLMTELASSEEDRRILELIASGEAIGRPLFTTPGVPPERIVALRQAFDATMQDPAFLADAARQSLDIDPLDGARLQQVVERIVTTPKETVAKLMAAIEGRDVVRDVSAGKTPK